MKAVRDSIKLTVMLYNENKKTCEVNGKIKLLKKTCRAADVSQK